MKYFTIDELCRSAKAKALGIDNTPSGAVVNNLTHLVDILLDPIREAWGAPITVNSGFRSPKLNRAVGGVATSQHQTGHAADITVGSREANKRLFDMINHGDFAYDQLIYEGGTLAEGPDWIHVSYTDKPRRMCIYSGTR